MRKEIEEYVGRLIRQRLYGKVISNLFSFLSINSIKYILIFIILIRTSIRFKIRIIYGTKERL